MNQPPVQQNRWYGILLDDPQDEHVLILGSGISKPGATPTYLLRRIKSKPFATLVPCQELLFSLVYNVFPVTRLGPAAVKIESRRQLVLLNTDFVVFSTRSCDILQQDSREAPQTDSFACDRRLLLCSCTRIVSTAQYGVLMFTKQRSKATFNRITLKKSPALRLYAQKDALLNLLNLFRSHCFSFVLLLKDRVQCLYDRRFYEK